MCHYPCLQLRNIQERHPENIRLANATRCHTVIYPPLLEVYRGRNEEHKCEATSLSMYGTSLQKSRCLQDRLVSVDIMTCVKEGTHGIRSAPEAP